MNLRFRLPKLPIAAVRDALRAFGPVFDGQRRGIAFGAFLSIAGAGLQLLRPWPIAIVFDFVLGGKGRSAVPKVFHGLSPEQTLALCCGLILALSAVSGIVAVRQVVAIATVGRTVATRIRKRVFEHMHRLEIGRAHV